MPRRVVIASGNRHKIDEIAAMLAGPHPELEVVGVKALGAPPEIAETEDTFHGNAALKAVGIASWLREQGASGDDLVLADDSGICIDAFDGRPGVYSARYAGPDATDEDNNAKMVAELGARGLDRSAAHYACVLALARVDGSALPVPAADLVMACGGALCVEGRCEGVVRTVRRGQGGFGYDPHFWVDDDARTFAELTREAKAARSHRGEALRRLLTVMDPLLDTPPAVQ